MLIYINGSPSIAQRIISWSVDSTLGSSHADQRLASISAPPLALLLASTGGGEAHKHSIVLLNCDDTPFFLLYFARDIKTFILLYTFLVVRNWLQK